MKLPFYQVDAFSARLFAGNPAGVVPLESWPDDDVLQAIAAENNLAETAFVGPDPAGGALPVLRWFTPTVEVDLCGHATLATAHVFWRHRGEQAAVLRFQTRSGPIAVTRREDGRLELDFPADPLRPLEAPAEVERVTVALGVRPQALWAGRDWVALLADAGAVRTLAPDLVRVGRIPARGLLVTSAGDEAGVDFVCRFFAPQSGVPEDPVTGSAYCALGPYWAERLGKTTLRARQLSARGGEVLCTIRPGAGRVQIAGFAVTYLVGEIETP